MKMSNRNELGHAVRREGAAAGSKSAEGFVPSCRERGCLRKHNSTHPIHRHGECGRLNCPVYNKGARPRVQRGYRSIQSTTLLLGLAEEGDKIDLRTPV